MKLWQWFKQWFHRMGSPRWFFDISARWMPWFAVAALLLLAIGFVWGLVFAPPDYQQGNAVRIIYLHVPAAILSQACYEMMAVAGVVLLVWRMKLADVFIAAAAPIGASFTALTLFTGGAWGAPSWGTWWVWDGRTTSTLLLLFLYGGVIALQRSVPGTDRAARAAALLCVVGVLNIPVIKYSVDWWLTMHQPSTFKLLGTSSMPPEMYIPMIFNAFGMLFLFGWAVMLAMRAEIAARESQTQWMRNYFAATS